MSTNRGVAYIQLGRGSPGHSLPGASRPARAPHRPRRDPQGRVDRHLWFRPAQAATHAVIRHPPVHVSG